MDRWMDESMNGWMDRYMKIQQKLIEYEYDYDDDNNNIIFPSKD